MMALLRLVSPVRFCFSFVDLQHSVARAPSSPSARLGFSPSKERESWVWKLDLPIVPGVTHKDRVSGPIAHHVPLHEVLEIDLVSERLNLWPKGDFGIFHHTDVPRNASDQRGHIDRALAGNHLLPVTEHGSDRRATDLICHGIQILQLRQVAMAEVCMRVHYHPIAVKSWFMSCLSPFFMRKWVSNLLAWPKFCFFSS